MKEQLEKLTEDKDKLQQSEQRNSEANKRLSRQLRDAKDELADSQRQEAEATQRKHDLVRIVLVNPMILHLPTRLLGQFVLTCVIFVFQENKVESLESDFEQSQSDLRLAFKRIADLQAVMEDDIDSDLDSEFDR